MRMKQLGIGAQAGERRLTEQTNRRIEAQKLAQLQAKEVSQNFISDLSDNLKFEEKILSEKHKLEGKVREHRYAALAKKADTDVARLEGEARQKKEYADWIAAFAPEFAKNLGKLAKGGLRFADKLKGIKEWNDRLADGSLKKIHDGVSDTLYKVTRSQTDDTIKLSEIGATEEANNLTDNLRFSSNWAKRKLLNHIKNNKAGFISEIKARFGINVDEKDPNKLNEALKIYNENSAYEILDFGARQILEELGVSENSEIGVEIIQQFQQWGIQAEDKFFKDRKVLETTERIEDLRGIWANLDSSSKPEAKQLAWENLVLATKNGWYRDQNGKINDPRIGETMDHGSAVIAAIKNDIEKRIGSKTAESITDFNDALENYAGLTTIIRKKGDKPELILNKFRTQLEEEEDWFNNLVSEEAGKNKKAKEAKDKLSLLDLQTEIKGLKPGEYTKEYRYNKAIAIHNDSSINDKAAHYEELFGDDYDGWTSADKFVAFHRAVDSGDEYTAMRILRHDDNLTDAARQRIVETNAILKRISEENPEGWTGVVETAEKLFKDKTGNIYLFGKGSTNTSGDLATSFYLGRVWDKVKGGMSLSEAISKETDLLEKAIETSKADPTNTGANQALLGSNPYHLTTAASGVAGTRNASVFTEFADPDHLDGNLVHDYLMDPERTKAAELAVRTKDIITYKPDQISDILKYEVQSKDVLIQSGRVVPFSYVQNLRETAIGIAEAGNDPYFADLPEHEGLTAFAEASGWSKTRTQNFLLQKYFPDDKIVIAEDSQDISMAMNNNKHVKPRDVEGTNMYNAAIIQNQLPMKPVTRMCTQQDRTVIEAYKAVEGIEWDYDERGGFFVNDWGKFFDSGGINKLMSEGLGPDVLKSLGFIDPYADPSDIPIPFQNTIKGE